MVSTNQTHAAKGGRVSPFRTAELHRAVSCCPHIIGQAAGFSGSQASKVAADEALDRAEHGRADSMSRQSWRSFVLCQHCGLALHTAVSSLGLPVCSSNDSTRHKALPARLTAAGRAAGRARQPAASPRARQPPRCWWCPGLCPRRLLPWGPQPGSCASPWPLSCPAGAAGGTGASPAGLRCLACGLSRLMRPWSGLGQL